MVVFNLFGFWIFCFVIFFCVCFGLLFCFGFWFLVFVGIFLFHVFKNAKVIFCHSSADPQLVVSLMFCLGTALK